MFYLSRDYFCRMRRFLVFTLLLISSAALAQEIPLSPQATISLLTFGPGQDAIFNAFGHSAIRVNDPGLRIDYFYNYGVFTFDNNFYVNFAKGHNRYQLGVYWYPENRDHYISENRSIHEQVINLTQDQKQKIFNYLQENARPENKYYNYDYFYDNCSTRIRDVFAEALKGEITFVESFIRSHYSIRQLESLYINNQPWGGLGINIGLGSPIDEEATPAQYMFLPDYLESFFDHATITTNGTNLPLVKEKIIVFQSLPEHLPVNFFTPWTVFGFILILSAAISYVDWKRGRLSKWFDFILLFSTGLLGVVLFLLWVATDHQACVRNFSLWWALPTNLVVCVFVFIRSRPDWLTAYFKWVFFLNLALLVLWKFIPQELSFSLIPLVCALSLRYAVNWRLINRPVR
jgi:Domain of unknown function (DUF4105)